MSIRKKAIAIFSGILLTAIFLQYVLANTVLLSSFSDLENSEVEEDVRRVANALTDQLSSLDNTAKDWGYWDETYAFIQGENDAYIEDNLSIDTMINLDINLMVFVNSDSTIRYSKVIDLTEGTEIPLSDTFQNHITAQRPILEYPDLRGSITGLVDAESDLFLLVAAVQITNNDVTMPSQGTLIFGRFLDETRIAALSKSTRLDFSAHSIGSPQFTQSGVTAFTSPYDVNTPIVKSISNEINTGLVGISDIYGEPAIVIELKSDRAIYQQGRRTFLILLGVMVAVGVVSFSSAILLLEKVVLSRLSVLSQDVSRIPESDRSEMHVSGNDEIAQLATVINSMLGVLRDSKRKLHLANEFLEAKVTARTQQLAQSIRHTEAILSSSSDALITTSHDGKITQINPAFATMYGYDADQLLGLHVWDVVTPEDIEILRQQIYITVEDHQSRRVEVTALRKDGSTFNADFALSVLVDGSGHVFGGVASIRDTSKHKLIEDNLREALAKERELRELKTRFVSMASHEFRTPLAIIQASLDLLHHYHDRLSVEERQDHFDSVVNQIRHMTDLLNQVLTMNRNDFGEKDYHPVDTDLDALCREIVDEIKFATNVTHRQNYSFSGQPEPILLDPKLIRGAVTNLLWNAIKYSPKGSTIDLQLCFEEKQVAIKVSDEGIGIPESDRKYLFQPFHRANNVGTVPGTGLGLAIIKQSIDMHSGSITYDSRENVGTTFIITLPRTTRKDYSK